MSRENIFEENFYNVHTWAERMRELSGEKPIFRIQQSRLQTDCQEKPSTKDNRDAGKKCVSQS